MRRINYFTRVLLSAALNVASAEALGADPQVNYFANFTKETGGHPASQPILAVDGNYYGVVPELARHGVGSIYRSTPDGGTTVLHRFKGSDGANPTGRLLQASDGALYGTTQSGGRGKGCGTVFKITPDGIFATIHFFNCGKHGGGYPAGGLVQGQDGLLYGMTDSGGNHRDGAVYSLAVDGTAFKLAGSFSSGVTGGKPKGELIQTPDGNFYGITSEGGAHRGGTLFSMSPAGTITRRHAWDPVAQPNSGLAYSSASGKIFGTLNGGILYFYENGLTRSFSAIHYGDSTLIGGVTLGTDNETLYGFCTTPEGGCVYSVNSVTSKSVQIAGQLKGDAVGEPIFGATGQIVGATKFGGSRNDGTLFTVQLSR